MGPIVGDQLAERPMQRALFHIINGFMHSLTRPFDVPHHPRSEIEAYLKYEYVTSTGLKHASIDIGITAIKPHDVSWPRDLICWKWRTHANITTQWWQIWEGWEQRESRAQAIIKATCSQAVDYDLQQYLSAAEMWTYCTKLHSYNNRYAMKKANSKPNKLQMNSSATVAENQDI